MVEEATEMSADDCNEHLVLAVKQLVADNTLKTDHEAYATAGRFLAMIAQKDIKWKKALEGEDRDKAIASFHAERDPLLDTVLVLIDEDHPQYATAIEQACPGRYLLDEKRSGMWKTRGVKQGFKENCKPARTPMDRHIDSDSPALSPDKVTKFFTANGFLGWLSSTNRPDITHTFSRIGQHQAAPTESAYAALYHAFCYLSATRRYRLSAPLYQSDQPLDRLAVFAENKDAFAHWEFYCDSDFAGNIEAQNKRRSQNGYIALLNGAPVYWVSKVASVAFACEDIGESHADVSSGAAEVYCAGNATMDFLHLSYVAAEMNIPFPKPFRLKMDNAAAQCFAEGSCFKSKLKHIDCRQEWVKILRDRDICIPVHVDTRDNLADIFTKILPVQVFERFRNRLMFNPDG